MVKQIYLHWVDSFLEDERLCGFIVADINFGTNCVDIFTHGEILIISGLFFVITKYAILMINDGERRDHCRIFKAEANKLLHSVVAIKWHYQKAYYSPLKLRPC